MARQMKNLWVFSVFYCVEGSFDASSRGTPKLKMGFREMSSKMVVVVFVWELETVSANRVAAINAPINDTDPIRKFGIDPGSHTDLQNPAKFSPKGKPIRNFSMDPTSSIRTPFLSTPFPRLLS